MSADETSYRQLNAYKSQFGHAPKSATHLINFAKKNGVSLNWKQASFILKNGQSNNTNNHQMSPKSKQRNNNKTMNTSSNHQQNPPWKLQTKIDPNTGKKVISSRGIPPPPGQTDIYSLNASKPKQSKAAKPKKIKISSRGIPPPPGSIDIWAQQQQRAHSQSYSQQHRYHSPKSPISPISPSQNHNFQNLHSPPPSHTTMHRSYSHASNGHKMHSPHIKQSQSFSFQSQSVPTHIYDHDKRKNDAENGEIDRMMKAVDYSKKQMQKINDIVPNIYASQKKYHFYLKQLSNQCLSTYISPAKLNDPFANADDPFAHYLRFMGHILQKCAYNEEKYLQTINKSLVRPIGGWTNNGFKKVYSMHAQYLQKMNEHNRQKDDFFNLSLQKLNLKNEMKAILQYKNNNLVSHFDSYWKSYQKSLFLKAQILASHSIKYQSMNDSNMQKIHSINEQNVAQNNDDHNIEYDENVHFDISDIDKKVGYHKNNANIVKFCVNLVQKSKKYQRAIYVCKREKLIKIVTTKADIMEYEISKIEKVQKEYNSDDGTMKKIFLKFVDAKEYFLEFECAQKREEFASHLFEYEEFATNNRKFLSFFVGSWNVGEGNFDISNVSKWILLNHDFYIIGLQEMKSKLKNKWIHGILSYLNEHKTDKFVLYERTFLMQIGILLIVNERHLSQISHLQCQTVATGKGNIIGNKGAAAISFQFMDSSFLFVNCHLAARAERTQKRAENVQRIVKELNLGRLDDIDILHQFTHVVWFGDLNYRVAIDWNSALEMVAEEKWNEMLKYDQLYDQMVHDAVFSGFEEGKINFCPTYRWDRKENTVSNKREQPPSYTDRILYRSLPNCYDLWQLSYNSSPTCFGSDHRPISSVFAMKPRIPYFAYSHRRKYDEIILSFDGLKAEFDETRISLNRNLAQNDKKNDDAATKKAEMNTLYPMEIKINFLYSSPNKYRIKNGQFMNKLKYDNQKRDFWKWRSLELDSLNICPFISDPSYLCKTHFLISFIQKSDKNVIGHCVLSLFDCFPKTLLDTMQIKQKYYSMNRHLKTMKQAMTNAKNHQNMVQNNDYLSMPAAKTNKYSKAFNVNISKNGINIGTFYGNLCVDGRLIRKHKKYSSNGQKVTSPHIKQSQSVPYYDNDGNSKQNISMNRHSNKHITTPQRYEYVHFKNVPFGKNEVQIMNKWECQFCTFLNINNQSNICQVCGGKATKTDENISNDHLFIYDSELAQLREMGFKEDEQRVKDLLIRNKGKVKVVAELLMFKFKQFPY